MSVATGGSQDTLTVSFPGSATFSLEGGHLIFGGSVSRKKRTMARREETRWIRDQYRCPNKYRLTDIIAIPGDFQTRAGSIPGQEHTYTFRLNSTPRAPALTGARMFAFNPITRVTGEVAPGVHLKPVSTGVSAVMDQRQYSTTHL